ncbi:hypothetical protein D3C84_1039400 [compost metagenome]
MKCQAGQRRGHGQRGNQQRQWKYVRRAAAERQQVVKQFGKQSPLLRPGHTRRERTPVIVDIRIVGEDQRQDIHQECEQKKQPDLATSKFFADQSLEPAHAKARAGLCRRRCP